MAHYMTTLKSNLQLVCKIFDTFLNNYVVDPTSYDTITDNSYNLK